MPGHAPHRLLARPAREQIPAGELELYDSVLSRQAQLWSDAPSNSDLYFGALLNSPPLAGVLAELGRFMRMGEVRGTYGDADRELVDIVLSVDSGYNAILALHIPDALAVGVRLEAIEALWRGNEKMLTDDERELTGFIRSVVGGTVDDDAFAAMCERTDARTALEYSAFITFLLSTMRLWQALGVPDPSDAEIDALLDAYRAGEGPAVDPAARIG